MNRGRRKKVWKRTGIVCLVSAGVLLGACSAVLYRNLELCREQKNTLEARLQSYERLVYVAEEKLPKGTVISGEKVRQELRYTDMPGDVFMTEAEFGMTVVTDIPEGTCLVNAMLCSPEGDVREVFFDDAEVAEHLQTGDRVDVRIRYGNAEDYKVLTDKILWRSDSGNGIVLELSEEEILMLSSAIADGQKYDNTALYVVEYPEYRQTETGAVTYIANWEILRLLGRENIEGENRIALEQRLEKIEK